MMIMHTWTLLHDLHHLVNGAAGTTSRSRKRRVDNMCKVSTPSHSPFHQWLWKSGGMGCTHHIGALNS